MGDLTPILFGLLVGFLVGLTGVGGGSLMTPFLVAVMMVPAPTAIGTDMVFATVTKMTGSIQHYRQRSVNLEVAVFLGLGSIPASLLGVWTLEWIQAAYDAETVRDILITLIAATLVLVGASLIFKAFLPERWTRRRNTTWDGKTSMSLKRRLFTILFGAAGGYLVGLTSIGSGSVMAVILLLLYPLAPAIVVGTDIAHATVLSLVTGFAHLYNGNVDLRLAGLLLVGSIPGVLVGSRLAPRLPGKPLTIVLAIMHQMEILPAGGTDAGGVQRLHGGIPSITLSIPCRYVHTPNEMVNETDVQACIDLLARYLEEVHTGDYDL